MFRRARQKGVFFRHALDAFICAERVFFWINGFCINVYPNFLSIFVYEYIKNRKILFACFYCKLNRLEKEFKMAIWVSALVMYLFNVFHNRPEVIFSLIWSNLFIVSATLSKVETLKYPSFHGICFFDEIFSSFNLVSAFFSNWDFSKTRL